MVKSTFFSFRLDIAFLIRHLSPQEGVLTTESIKLKFNKCEWKLLYLLWFTQAIFTAAGIYNIVWVLTRKSDDNIPYLVEACLYFF